MAPQRRILSVGYNIPGWSDDYLPIHSDRSLMDADIVLFQPTFRPYTAEDWYQGKRSFDDDDSAQIREHCGRWKAELAEAIKAGKTVIVFLSPVEDVWIHSGRTTYSGTGRNRQSTRHLEPLNSYDAMLPFDLGQIVPKGGSEIRVAGDLKQVAPYWAAFGTQCSFHVYMKGPKGTPLLTGKSPDAIVGLRVNTAKGTAILLPPVDYDEESYTTKDKKNQDVWTPQALTFGRRLIAALVELDRAVRADREITPAPDWASADQYKIPSERALEADLEKKDASIERLRRERVTLEEKIAESAAWRDLLYESGKPLEVAVRKALQVIGFRATPFKEDGSEFDVVFDSPEGRFLGEVEGKNDKAISIEKLDQLERNLREDFDREDTKVFAKGVLFGNGFRLREPNDRPDFFTDKCHASAARSKVALVRTTDLFPVVKYLDDHDDPAFTAKCRQAIFKGEGEVVVFPDVPKE